MGARRTKKFRLAADHIASLPFRPEACDDVRGRITHRLSQTHTHVTTNCGALRFTFSFRQGIGESRMSSMISVRCFERLIRATNAIVT